MSTQENSVALLHDGYTTVGDIWDYEIANSQVSTGQGSTTISYTFLAQLPSYYDGEHEADPYGFYQILPSSAQETEIKKILGVTAGTGYESNFTEVANISFQNVDNSLDADNVGAITFAKFDPAVVTEHDEASGYNKRLQWDHHWNPLETDDDKQQSDVWFNRITVGEAHKFTFTPMH
jgi:hypothetical protein